MGRAQLVVFGLALAAIGTMTWYASGADTGNTADVGACGDIGSLVSYSYEEAVAKEMTANPELSTLSRKAQAVKDPAERAGAVETILPSFHGTLASIMLHADPGHYYASVGRNADARRLCKAGREHAEKIIQQYPEAKFLTGVHSYAALMYFWPPDRTKAELEAALMHIDKSLSGTPSSDETFYLGRATFKGHVLAHLGNESASMAVYSGLLGQYAPCDNKETLSKIKVGRAESLLALNKKLEAKEQLMEILEESPEHSPWRKAASRLLERIDNPK